MISPGIAGMGWLTPLGRDLLPVWTALNEDRRPIPTFLKSPLDGHRVPVLRVPSDLIRDATSLPRLRRSSVISHLAVSAAVDAVTAARMTPEALKRTALIFAASDGGVVYTRKFYSEIVEHGEGAGSPLLFPETVYNAPASHIAARLGLEGEALTLVGDAAAGLSAVQTGCELLSAGEADSCLIVAAQELDWITCEAYRRWGLIQDERNRASIFSEGAAAIVLGEKSESCRVSASHPGYSYTTAGDAESGLKTIIEELLHGEKVDVVVSSASESPLDRVVRDCVARHFSSARLLAPKTVLGESLACSSLQEVIAAALALQNREGGRALVVTAGNNRQLAGLVLTLERNGS